MSTTPNSFEDFCERFYALQQEADSYGVSSVTVLLDDDRIAKRETKHVLHCGGHMAAVGMLEYGKHMMLRDRPINVDE